ncbi:MAG: methanogenesis marker protein Mmp4/MtxX [Candidatus Hodarchaeota archaeon]
MKIIDVFKLKGINKSIKIGIGLGESEDGINKILDASKFFLQNNESEIFLFAHKHIATKVNHYPTFVSLKSKLSLIESKEPETEILRYLNDGAIQAVIRGNLSSDKFIKNLKNIFNGSETNRLALLESVKGYQFFFGPVGIDECTNIEKKIIFIEKALIQFHNLKLEPSISILSGGRIGDIGRNFQVDNTINNAIEIVRFFKKKYNYLKINHDEILIENAIKNNANLIIAPDGISGNLIYRTLVHLGGGKAYGAIYMGLDHIILDTSRAGSQHEIYGALIMALALTD